MKKQILSMAAACAAAAMISAPALAENHKDAHAASGTAAKGTVEIVERGANGQATSVRIDGTVYEVCMKGDQDGCINPRAAGLNWGNRALEYWPGRPASEIEGPLPPRQGG